LPLQSYNDRPAWLMPVSRVLISLLFSPTDILGLAYPDTSVPSYEVSGLRLDEVNDNDGDKDGDSDGDDEDVFPDEVMVVIEGLKGLELEQKTLHNQYRLEKLLLDKKARLLFFVLHLSQLKKPALH
jgi:hypothetical protein